ncbi:MAG TPA: hypothetical protein VGC41_19370, partial [Kofleriaceae bacterium]
MELPEIDIHEVSIDALSDVIWRALLATIGSSFKGVPRPIAALWGLSSSERSGNFAVGDELAGFTVIANEPGKLLVLHGQHRFSEYELRFELGHGVLAARTLARFPGWKGRIYRALVIGS